MKKIKSVQTLKKTMLKAACLIGEHIGECILSISHQASTSSLRLSNILSAADDRPTVSPALSGEPVIMMAQDG